MKKRIKIIISVLLLKIITITNAQVVGFSSPGGGTYEMVFVPGEKLDNSAEFKKIASKMYITKNYQPTKVDNIIETIFLKYNAYKDEMEFLNDGQILFLKKERDRQITFTNSNTKYELFNVDNKLKYFIVHNDGKNQLLSRQIVTYQEAKPPRNSYVAGKDPDFIRDKDIFYIRFDKNNILEVPGNKKKFYALFKENESKIKKYIKSEKLDIKDIDDLKKIVDYSNSL